MYVPHIRERNETNEEGLSDNIRVVHAPGEWSNHSIHSFGHYLHGIPWTAQMYSTIPVATLAITKPKNSISA